MFSWYKYLIVNLVFFHLGFWSGNLFLIAPVPDLCLLVPFNVSFLAVKRSFGHVTKVTLFQLYFRGRKVVRFENGEFSKYV